MLLKRLLYDFVPEQFANVNASGVVCNCEDVKEGFVFFDLSSDRQKAFERAKIAVGKKAALVVSAFELPCKNSVVVTDPRALFARAAANFWGRACDKMTLVGITGTNGKTTTSFLVAKILQAAGHNVGVIGTNGVFFEHQNLPCPLTTPDADFLHKTFAQMHAAGVDCVVMEVSAHAIAQKRVDGILFDVGVLTNITQDHLDYFGSMENYAKTKLSFISPAHVKNAVVCADDERILRAITAQKVQKAQNAQIGKIAQEIGVPKEKCVPQKFNVQQGICVPQKFDVLQKTDVPQKLGASQKTDVSQKLGVPICTFGLKNPADVFAVDVCCTIEGSHFVANVCDEVLDIKTALVGQYNVCNGLAAMAACKMLGVPAEQLRQGLLLAQPVEGRFCVNKIDGKYVVVDFAHTPDGLKNVLQTAREVAQNKVHVVFGCGGNRDRDKRHKMGAIAEKLADSVCLTNDNPRFEDEQDIVADIEKGMKKPHFVCTDRALAIRQTIARAQKGDVVVVAGKGAEKYQEVQGEKRPYSDFDVIKEIFDETNPTKCRGKEFYF